MTSAPADLLTVRLYLIKTVPLSGDDVGIVGDPAHAATGGYHEGNDDLDRVGRLTSDYSKRESPRDRPGTNSASALDIGNFNHANLSLRMLSATLVAACRSGDPRTRDIREIIFSPDGKNVERWDRLGVRSTGDNSHLTHTHISFFRDSEGRRAQPDNILGLLTEIIEGDTDMSVWDETIGANYTPGGIAYGQHMFRTFAGYTWYRVDEIKALVAQGFADQTVRDQTAAAAIKALGDALKSQGSSIDTEAMLAHLDETTKAAVSTALAGVADQVVAKIANEVGSDVASQVETVIRSVFMDAGTK